MLDYNKVNFEFEQDPVWVPYQFTNLQFALIESFARIRAFPLYTRLVFAPLLKSWFRWEKVSEVVPRVLLLLVWYYIHWREMLDYNKESLNLSRTQCGPFINLQICSLLWLKVLSVLIESLIRFDQKFDQVRLKVFTNFGWKFDQAFINPDQVRLKVLIKSDWRSLIRFDWKFWSSLIESFHQFWLKVLIKLLSIKVWI